MMRNTFSQLFIEIGTLWIPLQKNGKLVYVFKKNEYIEQNINGDIRAGIFTDYDINTKRLYYYKISEGKFLSIPVAEEFDIFNESSVNILLSSEFGQKYLITGKTSNYTTFAKLKEFSTTTSTTSRIKSLQLINGFLLIDYYFLDDDERYRFSHAKHDYVIEQLFYTPTIEINDISRDVKFVADNPCKMMIWTVQMKYIFLSKDYYNYTS